MEDINKNYSTNVNKNSQDYTSDDIKILKGLEAVRLRPAMYIGSTDERGFHHLLWEILDNCVDESLAGFCNEIFVTFYDYGQNVVGIRDNGRGIPVDVHPETNMSTLETILTTLHAGGKFQKGVYNVSGGLHGVGASVVNALSSKLTAKVYKKDKIYSQDFAEGFSVTKLNEIANNTDITNGTEIIFCPSTKYFGNQFFNYEKINNRIREICYLNKQLKITVSNKIIGKTITYHYPNGLKDFITDLTSKTNLLFSKAISFQNSDPKTMISFEFIMTYSSETKEKVYTFCNTIKTINHGMHYDGFIGGFSKLVGNFMRKNDLLPKKIHITHNDITEGLILILSTYHPNPQFEGQTKGKLGNIDVRKYIFKQTYAFFKRFFEENPNEAKLIVAYLINCARARLRAKELFYKTKSESTFTKIILPGKLSDCTSKRFEDREIFIVEGDSAGGSAKLARNSETQAILPLKGKIINIQKESLDRIIRNSEIIALQQAIGLNLDEVTSEDQRENKNNTITEKQLKKLRYNKIILMTDADVDGHHIAILLLTFFLKVMPELFFAGKIYLACPPLFKVRVRNKDHYIYSDEGLKALKLTKKQKFNIQRYKGLGEMNYDQLWDTTMDPEKRKLIRIVVNSYREAKIMFEFLMGSSNVAFRKKFIIENSNLENFNLDI